MEPSSSYASGLRVDRSPGRGRGVFATRAFAQGEIVEVAPVLVMPEREQDAVDDTILDSYIFAWRETVALALGFGSLYNHSWTPNLEYRKHFDEQVIEFVAIREIAAGEELMTNYTSSNPSRPDLWYHLA